MVEVVGKLAAVVDKVGGAWLGVAVRRWWIKLRELVGWYIKLGEL